MTLRLTDDETAALRKRAELEGRSMQDVARAAVREYVERSSRRDLIGHSFISYIDDLIFSPELDYMPQISREIRPQLQSSNLIAQMQATIAGAGICVLPHFMAGAEPRLLPVLENKVILHRTFWLIVHADQQNLARIRSAGDYISDLTRTDRGVLLPTRLAEWPAMHPE